MITPDKYLNLIYSPINVGAIVIQELQKVRVIPFAELEKRITNTLGEDAKYSLHYALNFLFLIDKIKYEESLDSFSLKK
jgi:hypothetical protein